MSSNKLTIQQTNSREMQKLSTEQTRELQIHNNTFLKISKIGDNQKLLTFIKHKQVITQEIKNCKEENKILKSYNILLAGIFAFKKQLHSPIMLTAGNQKTLTLKRPLTKNKHISHYN